MNIYEDIHTYEPETDDIEAAILADAILGNDA